MDDVVPQLLRKPTSANENNGLEIVGIPSIGSQQDVKPLTNINHVLTENNQQFSSNQNRPKILHHRNTINNGQTSLEKQLNAHVNWMRFLFKLN